MAEPKIDPYKTTVRNTEDGGLDELVPYTSVVMAARLRCHEHTSQFAEAFLAVVGGGLRPLDGGSWERCRKASNWLRPLERKARGNDLVRLRERWDNTDREVRDFADLVCRLCGVFVTARSPLMTEGERLAWVAALDLAVFADIPDVFETISSAFPGAEVIPFPGAVATPPTEAADQTEEGASGGAPSSETLKKRLHEEEGITYPDDFFDDVDLSGSVSEVKRRLNDLIHAHLIAEVRGKGRKGLTDWLASKNRGYKIRPEWREDES